jgi:hypothetical protein
VGCIPAVQEEGIEGKYDLLWEYLGEWQGPDFRSCFLVWGTVVSEAELACSEDGSNHLWENFAQWGRTSGCFNSNSFWNFPRKLHFHVLDCVLKFLSLLTKQKTKAITTTTKWQKFKWSSVTLWLLTTTKASSHIHREIMSSSFQRAETEVQYLIYVHLKGWCPRWAKTS